MVLEISEYQFCHLGYPRVEGGTSKEGTLYDLGRAQYFLANHRFHLTRK